MPDKNVVEKSNEYLTLQKKFQLVDTNLEAFGFTKDKKIAVFRVLSAILNLGNIRFQNTTYDSCFIQATTKECLDNAATLLNVDKLALESALINRSREIANQLIK